MRFQLRQSGVFLLPYETTIPSGGVGPWPASGASPRAPNTPRSGFQRCIHHPPGDWPSAASHHRTGFPEVPSSVREGPAALRANPQWEDAYLPEPPICPDRMALEGGCEDGARGLGTPLKYPRFRMESGCRVHEGGPQEAKARSGNGAGSPSPRRRATRAPFDFNCCADSGERSSQRGCGRSRALLPPRARAGSMDSGTQRMSEYRAGCENPPCRRRCNRYADR